VLGLGCGRSRSVSQDSCPETEGISDDEDRDGDEDEKDDRHFLRNATRTLIWDIAN